MLVVMSTKTLCRVVGAWLVAVTAITVLGLVAGVPLTLGTTVLVVVIATVPPAVVVSLFRERDTATVAEMLRQQG